MQYAIISVKKIKKSGETFKISTCLHLHKASLEGSARTWTQWCPSGEVAEVMGGETKFSLYILMYYAFKLFTIHGGAKVGFHLFRQKIIQ